MTQTPAFAQKFGAYRWTICALLFFATTINYMDRQIIGVLKPLLQNDLKWNEIDYSNIVFFFQLAYACGQLGAGRFMDRFGVRIGYAIAVAAWSLAAMGHGLARTVVGFSTARLGLGVAEGGNFPGAIKTVSLWFPQNERALATGIFNSGSNMGALFTPLIVPYLAARWGWPAAFYFTGALGFFWLIAWTLLYRDPPAWADASTSLQQASSSTVPGLSENATADRPVLTNETPTLITADPLPSWISVIQRPATQAYVLASMITGPVWWFYLFWAPDFFNKQFHLDLKNIGLPLATVYLMSDFGSIAGGWCSSHLIRLGWSVNSARKTAMLLCALAVVPVFVAGITHHQWLAVVLIGLAAAAHQGWSANLYTFVSDTSSRRSISTIVGIGGLMGGLAGMVVAKAVGYVLQYGGSYLILLCIASCMYLLALAIIQLLVPQMREEI